MSNGLGGFSADGKDYVVVLDGDRETPLPWVNVIANPSIGTIVSASGSSFTWAQNSRENRLTPFWNDPVTDPTAEALFVRDDETGDAWSPTPGPMRRTPASGRFVIRHSAGLTTFTRVTAGIDHELEVFVERDRAGQVLGVDADQPRTVAAPAERLRLRGVVARAAARRSASCT